MSEKIYVIPPARTRYLSEIAENNRSYDERADQQVAVAQQLFGIYKTICSVLSVDSQKQFADILRKGGLNEEFLAANTSAENETFMEAVAKGI